MPDPILISILVTTGATLLAQLFHSIKSNHFTSTCCKDENGKSCMSVELDTTFKDGVVPSAGSE